MNGIEKELNFVSSYGNIREFTLDDDLIILNMTDKYISITYSLE